jgi:hypothetical protein
MISVILKPLPSYTSFQFTFTKNIFSCMTKKDLPCDFQQLLGDTEVFSLRVTNLFLQFSDLSIDKENKVNHNNQSMRSSAT